MGKKTIIKVLNNLKILERIYIDLKLPWEYYDNLEELRNRLLKLPKLSEKNTKLLEQEINYCKNTTEELYDEINPDLIKKYKNNKNDF